jgi:hypothetical protein
MKRRIAVTAPVRATAEEARAVVNDWGVRILPDTVQVKDRTGLSVAETVRIELTPTTSLRPPARVWAIRWQPVGHGRVLPMLTGRLEVVEIGDEAELCLTGAYRVPLGILGALADRLRGSAVAHRSLSEFLDDAARRVEVEARGRRESGPLRVADYPPDLRSDRHIEGST